MVFLTDIVLDASQAAAAATASNNSGATWAFWIFGALTVLAALATITRRNPVTAAMFLVLTLICTAGLYLTMHATFLAAIQVLVYAGAVMVLFVFVVMAVAHYDEEHWGAPRGVATKVVGVAALLLLLERMVRAALGTDFAPPQVVVPDSFGDVKQMGELLLTKYLFPFEAISILLLVAIVGAVMITRFARAGDRESRTRAREQSPPDREGT